MFWKMWWPATALAFVGAGLFHLVKGVGADTAEVMMFHVSFAIVDPLFAAGFLWRPTWFPVVFAGLVVQQLYSHGGEFLAHWSEGRLDAISLVVVVMMPVWLLSLMIERRRPARHD